MRRCSNRRDALRARVAGSILLGFILFAVAGGPAWARDGAEPAPSGAADAVLIAPSDTADANALIATVEATGARAAIVLLPRTVVAAVPGRAAARLRAAGFAVRRAGAPPPAGATPETRLAVRLVESIAGGSAWKTDRSAAADPASLGSDLLRSPYETGFRDPLTPAVPLAGAEVRTLPKATEPAAFAAGSVAVAIVFTESDGSIDTSTEDWTNDDPLHPGDRRTAVVTRVLTGLAWWYAREPAAKLTFVVPAPGATGAVQTAASGREPIKRAGIDDASWRHPVMAALGYRGAADDDPPPETAFDDAVRKANGADWAFTLYVVDSLDDANGRFKDGLFAYTFTVFGPYSVLTYDNGGYGIENLAPVLAHEMGHVFGALDEYAPPNPYYPSTGDLYSGYLWVQNRNAVVGGTTDYVCLMRGGDESLQAFEQGLVDCPSTRGQIGWRDANGNAAPDVIDTAPSFVDGPQAYAAGAVTVTGTVRENPWPHGSNKKGQAFTHDISVYPPRDVEFRVDGGAWGPVIALDGVFDGASEQFSLTTEPLADGYHILELSATTGGATTQARDIWAGDVPVTLDLTATKKQVVVGAGVTLNVAGTSGGHPVPFLGEVKVGTAGGRTLKTVQTDRLGLWSGRFTPRFTTRYVARFATSGQYVGPAESAGVTIGVKPVITARRAAATIKKGKTMRISGHFKPVRKGVRLALQETGDGGASWKTLGWTRTNGRSDFVFSYRAKQKGTVRLRVYFPGDGKNVTAAKTVTAFTVL